MKIGMSEFARKRHVAGSGYSYFAGTEDELLEQVHKHWSNRVPGMGRTDLDKVVVVTVSPCRWCGADRNFVGTTATLTDGMTLLATVERRQPQEDPAIKVYATNAVADPIAFAKVVCYSAAALLENDGKRSGDYDWEIVALVASTVENEPMYPLAMARNFLEKPGGTKCNYTAEQFAEAIYYWSTKVRVL